MRKWLAVAVLSLAACTMKEQYRDTIKPLDPVALTDLEERNFIDDGSGEESCSELLFRGRSIERFREPEFNVGVIELSDDGHVKDLTQMRMVLDDVRRVGEERSGITLVVFIHGWHHRAKVCDENLSCFRRVLQGLAIRNGGERPVYGVYVGWRGESAHHATWSTFYNRKATAHRVGGKGGEDVLLRLHNLHEELEEKYSDDNVIMVTVGHSFGGALVYSAIESLMVGELRNKHVVGDPPVGGVKPVRSGFGDLTVLVNPAFEAERYRAFAEDLKNGKYSETQKPVLLTVASEADGAVGKAFPAGRTLWIIPRPWKWDRFRPEILGLGHYGPYATHRLDFDGTHPTPPKLVYDEAAIKKTIADCGLSSEKKVRPKCNCTYPFDMPRSTSGAQMVDQGEGTVTTASGSTVRLRALADDFDPNTPFLVAVAPANLIDGHNDIYNPNFIAFLTEYITGYVKEQANN